MYDPLAAVRATGDPDCDVYLTGTVFLDIVFTGLDSAPRRGTETWARGMGSSPGGVANMATALARLGLRTSLAAAFGDDVYGAYCWEALAEGEGVDLTHSRKVPGWHSPVTVSMAYDGERTMVTHGHDAPPEDAAAADPPRSLAAVASLVPGRTQEWVNRVAARGTRVFADVGWDDSGRWRLADLAELADCEAFLPNAEEAMRYTRTRDPREAARALTRHVPLAVVTMGPHGVCAADGRTGEFAEVPGVLVEALDPTGAGDVFTAGFLMATLADWPLAERLAFASLTSALSVQEFGGSLSAPGWAEIGHWCRQVHGCPVQDPVADAQRCRYGFLWRLLSGGERPAPLRRAVPTVGFRQPSGPIV
ncbi:carbohydrate kinase family protein [Streptomyces alkaliterrae]|uniref:Sugar kinase n=1 Tax=Streptomyces alkaliterrae TaxID=2213162 RepID=A0A5P0YJ27_9ACTN|nr:PfkB family carbohydrate kinase [Streptomyces alkaliterrae]MBB1251999.1 sugar kinase [Streptomyces alkaliterrae]MBB1257496.1 sugar kinase [Streptomyces alkaliterrae]MQS00384.1 sugar kinase [Streptomyces alkaliterrae]